MLGESCRSQAQNKGWRSGKVPDQGTFADVYDGKVWQEVIEHTSYEDRFMSSSKSFGLMLLVGFSHLSAYAFHDTNEFAK